MTIRIQQRAPILLIFLKSRNKEPMRQTGNVKSGPRPCFLSQFNSLVDRCNIVSDGAGRPVCGYVDVEASKHCAQTGLHVPDLAGISRIQAT